MSAIPIRTTAGASTAFRTARPVRSHRRPGASRAELIAAGFGGATALALLLVFERKVIRRG